MALGLASVAHGQASTDAPTPETQPAAPAPVERIFGDWGGLQPTLEARGIDLQLSAVAEIAGNTSGGVRQGATSANQVALNLDVDFDRLAGLSGFSTHLIIVNRSGSSDSHLFGDNLLPVQQIYGSGGDAGAHLVSLYAEESLAGGRLDLTAGRMNVENDFASSSLYCNYMNNALCGDPKALPGGDIGHSAYPDAVWAARVRLRPTAQTYIEVGAYEANQGLYTDKYDRTGFEFNTSRDSGVYIPVEIGWEPTLGPDRLPGHYKLGFGYDTSPGYKDFGNALASAMVPGYTARTHTGNVQVWGLADQMLVRNDSTATGRIIALAGFIFNDPNNTAYGQQYFAGVEDTGFWRTRPKDSINLLFTYVNVSRELGRVEQVEQSLSLPLSNGATGIQSHEMVAELDYNIHVYRGFNVRPDFQYVVRPNAEANIHNATVFGVHTDLEF